MVSNCLAIQFFLGFGLQVLDVVFAQVRLSPGSSTVFSAGTLCSGTDCVVMVMEKFLKAAANVFRTPEGQLPQLQHLFSCEKEPNKQRFLRDFFQMGSLHPDALEPIPDKAGYISAGFPCDDASALHPHSATAAHRLCVAEAGSVNCLFNGSCLCQGSLRTGSVFRAICKHLAFNDKVSVFQFENVTSLACKPSAKSGKGDPAGPSNLSAVVYLLEKEAGMLCHVWQLDSRQFGSGQQRQRLYGSCFKKDKIQLSPDAARKILDEGMSHCMGVQPCHPEEYLLSVGDKLLKHERCLQTVRFLPEEAFADSSVINTLFQTGGVLPCAAGVAKKKRKLCDAKDTSPPGAKWVKAHSDAFKVRGEDAWRLNFSFNFNF